MANLDEIRNTHCASSFAINSSSRRRPIIGPNLVPGGSSLRPSMPPMKRHASDLTWRMGAINTANARVNSQQV